MCTLLGAILTLISFISGFIYFDSLRGLHALLAMIPFCDCLVLVYICHGRFGLWASRFFCWLETSYPLPGIIYSTLFYFIIISTVYSVVM